MSILSKNDLFSRGVSLMEQFCDANTLRKPELIRLAKTDRLYHLASCAYYRPEVIKIMVEKCASPGMGGMAWSWPGYAIDRTPYGVIQHELGHHVDEVMSATVGPLFSRIIYDQSLEEPLTGYLGTDQNNSTYFKEWFAENFRLFVTNPDLCEALRPKFHQALRAHINPLPLGIWTGVLLGHKATDRIIEQAAKKVSAVRTKLMKDPMF